MYLIHWSREHLIGELVGAALIALLITAALFALTKWGFGLLKQKRQQVVFCAAAAICLIVILDTIVLSLAYLQARPNFKTYIRMAITGATTDLNVSTPVILVIPVANIGTMRSTVEGWQLIADLNGHKYDSTAVTPPARDSRWW